MAAVTFCSDFEPQENKVCHCFSIVSPTICHEVMGPDAMIFIFWMMSFKPAFPTLLFHFIKRVFSSSQRWDNFVVAFYVFFLARLFPPLLTELTPPHTQYLISCITSSQTLWPFKLLAWSLCWDDLLEKAMATYSSILAWRIPWRRIPWTEEPGGLQSMGSQRVRHDWMTNHTHTHTHNTMYFMSLSP